MLRLNTIATRLATLKSLGKLGVLMLALMLAALPVVGCMLPGAAMTAAERDCCKKMAERCGGVGMEPSHSCCHPNDSLDNRPVAKAASPTLSHFTFAVLHIGPQAELVAPTLTVSNSWAIQLHDPPGQSPPDNTVLRI